MLLAAVQCSCAHLHHISEGNMNYAAAVNDSEHNPAARRHLDTQDTSVGCHLDQTLSQQQAEMGTLGSTVIEN